MTHLRRQRSLPSFAGPRIALLIVAVAHVVAAGPLATLRRVEIVSGDTAAVAVASHRRSALNTAVVTLSPPPPVAPSTSGKPLAPPAAPQPPGSSGNASASEYGPEFPPTYDQRLALAELRVAMDPEGLELESWDSDVGWPFWMGVQCDQWNQVIKLSLSGNELTGSIPEGISHLTALQHLDVRGNVLQGSLVGDIGRLSALTYLDLSNNRINGSLPHSLSNLTALRHLDLHHNPISGALPSSIAALSLLTRLDLHDVDFTPAPLPPSLGALSSLHYLDLAYTHLTGPLPASIANLSALNFLSVDGNALTGSIDIFPPNSSLQAILAGHNQLEGAVPDVALHPRLRLLSLHDNNLTGPVPAADLNSSTTTVVLAGNPLCTSSRYYSTCNVWQQRRLCTLPCSSSGESPSPVEYVRSQECVCALPVVVRLFLQNPSYTLFNSEYADRFQRDVEAQLNLQEGQAWLDSVSQREDNLEVATLRIYSAKVEVPWTEEQRGQLYAALGRLTRLSAIFGGVTFDGPPPPPVPSPPPPPPTLAVTTESKSTFPVWAIVVTAVGLLCFAASLLLLLWLRHQRRRQMLRPSKSKLTMRLQEQFVRPIALAEIEAATDGFSEARLLGVGGYGSVYRGDGLNGEQWAVKRATVTTVQSMGVFQNEVDVISAMSHRNLIALLGYCEDKGEQILVYEFAANGTLSAHLRPPADKPTAPLTLQQRVEVALGAAQGLFYLHSFARPPVIHRDVKSGNILLDQDMQAKVADFGLLKASKGEGVAHSTQVAGTPGYLDPEYYSAFKVTAKSDVYSFGVVLLEILTGLPPIFESLDANESTDGERQMTSLARWCAPYVQTGNVAKIVDPRLGADCPVDTVKAMAEVAMACVQRHSKNRPDTGEVVRRLGDILARLTGDESAATLGHLRSQSSNVGAVAIPEDGEIDPNIALVNNYGRISSPGDDIQIAMAKMTHKPTSLAGCCNASSDAADAGADADFFEGEDEDDDFYRLDDDDVPLLKRKLRLHLRGTTKRTRVVLSDDDIPVEEPQHRLSAAEKGKMKIVEGPSNEYRRRRTWKAKKKNDGSSVSSKGAKKKKTAQGTDYIVVNEMHVSNDEYATAARPLPSFPENAKPKDLTLRNADSRPPSPRSRGEKRTRRSWSVREKMRWARRYKEPSSLKKTLFESSASVACIRRWAAQTDSGA
ncbi:unnamed protein product [Closterium sp. NIES-65]|nr:unnamed protein product [Closterium sp. NIES-65]